MGLSDLFKKKNKEPEKPEVKEPAEEIGADGWLNIEKEFLRVYPGQTKPKHYGTLVKWRLGGNDPLDGISIYDGGNYWHFVTFGLSELYEKESENKEISGYGYEMTLKLKKYKFEDEEAEIKNICGILQSIARITFNKGEIFLPSEFIYTGQQTGMDAKQKSNITGFITIADTSCVTSGDYERYFIVNGKKYHHIIDKDTLMPADYFSSVTIIANDSGLADCLSTALFCMSYEEGLALVEKIGGVEVLWIYSDGTMKTTQGFDALIVK